MKIAIEGSARHIHVSRKDLDTLFGAGYELRNIRELSQPGQYLTEEKVRVEGPRGGIDRVSVLGPERKVTQVELSLTDARVLGINPPVRESGDLAGSAAVKVIGPAGAVELAEGAIIAKRHIHLHTDDAKAFGLTDKQIVSVRVGGERGVVFGETVVRVADTFRAAMHIDYDEANAAGGTAEGEIVVG